MERYAVAELILSINAGLLSTVLKAIWTAATDTLMIDLAGQFTASYLAPIGLTLYYDRGLANTRVFSIQSGGVKWLDTAYAPLRMYALPPLPSCNANYIASEMRALIGGAANDTATAPDPVIAASCPPGPHDASRDEHDLVYAELVSEDSSTFSSAPVSPSAWVVPSPSYKSPSFKSPSPASPTYTSPTYTSPTYASPTYASPSPVQPAAVAPPSEMLSVTIPLDYPRCGSEMTVRSPSTGQIIQFSIPAGSQPGSQVLLTLQRS